MARPSIFRTIILLLTSLWVSACQENVVCEDVTSVNVGIGFYSITEANQAAAATIDSLSIYGAGKPDHLIYDNRKNVSRVELPLNPSADTCEFVLIFPGQKTNTLRMVYDRQLNLMSVECGFSMFFDLAELQYSGSSISQHEISTNLVSNAPDENIKLFVTVTDLMP